MVSERLEECRRGNGITPLWWIAALIGLLIMQIAVWTVSCYAECGGYVERFPTATLFKSDCIFVESGRIWWTHQSETLVGFRPKSLASRVLWHWVPFTSSRPVPALYLVGRDQEGGYNFLGFRIVRYSSEQLRSYVLNRWSASMPLWPFLICTAGITVRQIRKRWKHQGTRGFPIHAVNELHEGKKKDHYGHLDY